MININESYYNKPALSASALKDYDYSPKYFKLSHIDKKIKKDLKSRYLELGTLCHFMLGFPNEFNKMYAVFDKEINESTELIANYIINVFGKKEAKFVDNEVVIAAVKELNFYKNIKKDDTLLKKLISNHFFEYFEFIISDDNANKIIISNSLYIKALEIVNALKENEFVKDIVLSDNKDNAIKDSYVYNEIPIYFNLKVNETFTPCKILPDKIIMSVKNKVINIYDYKFTSNSVDEFRRNILKFKYYIQAGFYHLITKEYYKQIYSDIDNFKIIFNFVVVNTEEPNRVLIYPFSNVLIKKSLEGFASKKGVNELLESYAWAKKENHFIYHKKEYENKGKKILNIEDFQ